MASAIEFHQVFGAEEAITVKEGLSAFHTSIQTVLMQPVSRPDTGRHVAHIRRQIKNPDSLLERYSRGRTDMDVLNTFNDNLEAVYRFCNGDTATAYMKIGYYRDDFYSAVKARQYQSKKRLAPLPPPSSPSLS